MVGYVIMMYTCSECIIWRHYDINGQSYDKIIIVHALYCLLASYRLLIERTQDHFACSGSN